MTRLLTLTVCLALCATAALGQDVVPKANYSASLGSVTLQDQQLYRLSFRPDVPLGNWGIALDIELFIDNEGNFSDRGWEFDTSTSAINTFFRKLYYVRYGKPNDDIFFKVGALDDVTLGYGLIMDGYRNTLQYPGIKNTGLQFELKRMGGMEFGLQGVINNFQDFQEGGAMVGLRASARPAGRLEFGVTYVVDIDQYGGLLDSDDDGFPDAVDAFPANDARALDNDGDRISDEEDGDDDNDGAIDIDEDSGLPLEAREDLASLNDKYGNEVFPVDRDVSRKNPFNKDRVDGDSFAMLGFDVAYPLIEEKHLNLRIYGQFATIIDDDDKLSDADADAQGVTRGNRKAEGFGIAAPGLWVQAGPLDGRIEFRRFQDDFDSGYFDNLYDLDRARLDVASGRVTPKDARLVRDESQSGVYGHLGAHLGSFVYAGADYQYLTGGDDAKQQVHASARLSDKFLENIPRLRQARAYFQKNNIGAGINDDGEEDGFFDATEDMFFGYALALEVNQGVSLMWDTRFFYERSADGGLDRAKVMFIETIFNF
jgi:hypothetical protein